jgi:Protein of unknown function (DUF1071)
MPEKKMNPIDLLKINVNEYTEKKNGLTYLSWAGAWGEALKADPAVNFKVEMFDGTPLMMVGGSFMVWVTVTMFGKPVTCMLPVLDYRNKPINTPNAFDVNTSIMRCLVKAIAMHGLGLYIYAGDDAPEEVEDTPAVDETKPEKAEPKPVAKVEPKQKVERKPKPDEVTEWDNSDASRQLFADGMIEYTHVCQSLEQLQGFWGKNHLQLDSLKRTHPELYQRVLTKFSELKQSFIKEAE